MANESASGAGGRDPRTLTIDIGGTGIKTMVWDGAGTPIGEHERRPTPDPAHPDAVIDVLEGMIAERAFDRVSVGFPGVVVRGVVKTAPNLDTERWRGCELRAALETMSGCPVRVLNDADLQGYGVVQGRGVELVLTLGTGLGSALFTDGHLVPNLELAHHPWRDGRTYEQRLSDRELKTIGVERFVERVHAMLAELEPILNYERLHLGGGNARFFGDGDLPENVSLFEVTGGMRGGVRMWQLAP